MKISEFFTLISKLNPMVKLETITYYHTRNHKKLKAMLWKPKGDGPFPLVAFDVGLQFRVWQIPLAAEIMAKCGYAVIGTDYRKIEVAKGEVEDIASAIEYAKKNFSFLSGKVVLVGISMGGAAMLKIAALKGKELNIVGVAAMAPFSDLSRNYYYASGYKALHDKRALRVRLLQLYLKHTYITPDTNPEQYDLRSPKYYVSKINCPVLLIHGKGDEIVPVEHAIELYHRMKYYHKNIKLKIVSGEGIHTPLYVFSMLKNLNVIGFVKTWSHVVNFLKKLKKSH